MELLEAIAGRRSIRQFTQDEVPDEDIAQIIRAAGLAPSASNQQQWRFIVIKNKELIAQMAEVVRAKIGEMLSWPESQEHLAQIAAVQTYSSFFERAPVVIGVLDRDYTPPLTDRLLLERGMTFQEIYHLRGDGRRQSLGAAIQNLLLTAHSLGYGTCWMTGPLYAGKELGQMLGVEADWRLAAFIPLGRPAESPGPRARKPLDEIMSVVR